MSFDSDCRLFYRAGMMPAQVAFQDRHETPSGGLRVRKRAKTRAVIEDAAFDLFELQGFDATTVEQIAERADVSMSTFFRYFPSKVEVVLSDHRAQLPPLHDAIAGRPTTESDLVAVWRGLEGTWLGAIDAERTAHKTRVVESSGMLSALRHQNESQWLATVKDALALRQGLARPDARYDLAARTALAVLASAFEEWISSGCVTDLGGLLEERFQVMASLCAEWVDGDRSEGGS
jgi:AcrR family transcriptional regulator